MDEGILFEAKLNDGSKANKGVLKTIFSVGKRMLTGESLFLTHFTNTSHDLREVSFGAPYPGSIIDIDLNNVGGAIICQKDAFLCAALGTEVTIAFNQKLGSGFFGGEGFILQKLRGNGHVFLHAGGTVVRKQLNGGKLLVDTGCIVGFSEGIKYSVQRAGNLKSMLFGGEGLFLATLEGHGTVYLQSLPFSRLADRIIQCIPTGKNSSSK